MTKLVDLLEIIPIGNGAVFITNNQEITKEDIILAQTQHLEKWFCIEKILQPPYLRKGYSLLILTEKEVS